MAANLTSFTAAILLLGLFCPGGAEASDSAEAPPLRLSATAIGDPSFDNAMSDLARDLLDRFPNYDLDTRFRLEFVARRYDAAERTIVALRNEPAARPEDHQQHVSNNFQYQIAARARAAEEHGQALGPAFASAFDTLVGPLDNETSALVLRMMNVGQYGGLSLTLVAPQLRKTVTDQLAGRKSGALSTDDAIALVRSYQVYQAYLLIERYAAASMALDDSRRYWIETNVRIPTSDGVMLCALVVRPRKMDRPVPTLFSFTIYADPVVSFSEARRVASHDYAGVIGFTRGKACGSGEPVPRERDGVDAVTIIGWIAARPWSDGRVGMFGGSYAGFTQWAAAKHRPKALKTIMTSVAMAPGINSPAEGAVADGGSFYWPHYAAAGPWLNGAANDDTQRWKDVFDRWYREGAAYRDLDQIDGTTNPWFDKWLAHPGLDTYWRSMLPTADEFRKIDIPVLATTGYFDGGMLGTLFYNHEHVRERRWAAHYLVFGPYDHGTGNRGTMDILGAHRTQMEGWALDDDALIDMGTLRFAWFDHIFKGAPKPELLKDRINFQVMGADEWRHVPSIDTMGPSATGFFIKPGAGGRHLLGAAADGSVPISLRVDLADRPNADLHDRPTAPDERLLAQGNGLVLETDAFPAGADLIGAFGVDLIFTTNKRDFDIRLEMFERSSDGVLRPLSTLTQRISFARDRRSRRLLDPGKTQHIAIRSGRVVARRMSRGSRVVALLSIPRGPEREINYGSGKPVSSETVEDAGDPLMIEFSPDTKLMLPIQTRETK